MIKEEIVQEEKIANKTSHLIDQWKVMYRWPII